MSTFERPRKEVLSTKRSRASCAASRCKPLHQGKHRDQLQWTTTCRAQDIHCMRAPVPFHESKRVSRSRHRYHMVCEYVMRRRTSEDSEVSFHHQTHAARAKSASPRPSTRCDAHASLELLVKRKRRSCSKSRTSSNSVALGLVHCAIYLYTALACYPANPMPCVAMSVAFDRCKLAFSQKLTFTVRIAYLAVQRVYGRALPHFK